MKKTIFLFLATLLLTACSKDNASQTASDILPPITTSGANTAGCIINGKIIIPKNSISSISGFPAYGLKCRVGPNFGTHLTNEYFSVDVTNLKNQGLSYSIYIHMNDLTNGIGIYNIGKSNNMTGIDGPNNPQIIASEINGTMSTGKRFVSGLNSGTINITRFDYANKILSGIFNCKLYNIQNPAEKIEVTDGSFDINLTTLNQ